MEPEIVMLPHPSCESGDNERIEEKVLEEGEIEDDESADEGLHLSRSLLPDNDLIKTSKRKRRRKAVSKKIKRVLKKMKLNHTSSFKETMEVSLHDGTVQTKGNLLLVQGKYPVIHSNNTLYKNRDEYSSRDCSDPDHDTICPKTCNIHKAFCLGIKRPSQKSLKREQKQLCRKTIRLENRLCKNDPLPSELKMKLCKFCPKNKNDKYSYMHSEFHCKFSKTEVRCITGDHCKFRDDKFTKKLTSPKKIIGNYPQLIGDTVAEVIYTRNCDEKITKKIPSLLEIVVPIPPQILVNDSSITVNAEQSTLSECQTTSVDETRPCTLMPYSLKKENFSNIQQGDIKSFVASRDPNHHPMRQIVRGKKKDHSNKKEKPMIFNRQSDISGCVYDCISVVSPLSSKSCTKKSETETKHHRENIFPYNLPKKQQELFLRIQQKQRQPRNRDLGEQDITRNEEDEKQRVDEQNCYSSDEDDSSLVDVLKNLPRLQSIPSKGSMSSISTPMFDTPSSSSMSQSADKFLSSVRDQSSNNVANLTGKSVPRQKICENLYTMMQTLGTQSKETRFTLQNPYHSTISATISSVGISEHNTQTPVPTNSSSEEAVTYCRSLGNTSAYKAVIESYAGEGTRFSKNCSSVVDFGNVHNVQQNMSLQPKIKRDVDLRQNSIPLTSYFSSFNENKIQIGVPSKVVDIKGKTGLPFGPTSLHPATEINGSLNSHAPIPYKLIPITIPPPDYPGLTAYAQISRDPRLHRPSTS